MFVYFELHGNEHHIVMRLTVFWVLLLRLYHDFAMWGHQSVRVV